MAISRMAKVVIVSHRSEAADLLEALQQDGLCQVLNAEEAMVTKDWPELETAAERPKDIEDLLNRLTQSIAFLKDYARVTKTLASALAPRTVIDQSAYDRVVSDKTILSIVQQCGQTEATIEKLKAEIENICGTLDELHPWAAFQTPVEEIGELRQTTCLAGLLPSQKFEQIRQQIIELGGAIQRVGTTNSKHACLIVCLNEKLAEAQKLLRSADFEQVGFEPMTGTVAQLIVEHTEKLNRAREQLQTEHEKAARLSESLLKLEILCDHYANLLSREQTKSTAPVTEQTVIFEGWTRQRDYPRLEKIVLGFAASSLSRVEPAEGEEIPVEIENTNIVRPFEVITRLYGMPQHFEVDPTAFLAPFFAVFFALCLTDAGYGLVLIAATAVFIRKMQGDKRLIWMLSICSVATVAAGAMTGGWFGDAVQQLNIGWLNAAREGMMWFDPLEDPMMFFKMSLVLGYIQILVGLLIALVCNLKRKDFTAALFDQLTWLVMLNSVVIYVFIRGPAGRFFGILAIVPAAMIFLFSQRHGGLGERLGMGAYNLFSAIFYMGDVLSYLRLMALGMVTAGLAMAINVIATITLDIPYGIGIVLTILILVGGHSFNLALNALGAFVHTLRLQYVEFFPKFFIGGGRLFEPLSKQYRHVYIQKKS